MRRLKPKFLKDRKLAPIVPGFFTFGNMLCGFISIIQSTEGKYSSGAWLIIFGAMFDMLDGKIARLTRGTSEIGVQLDSLSDFLTFGVAPGILLFSLGIYRFDNWGFIIPVLYLLAGAFRLARYNVNADAHVKADFQGLPIPLAALFVTSFIIFSYEIWDTIKYVQIFTPAMVLLSWLMVSNVRYPAAPKLPKGKAKWLAVLIAIPVLATLIKPRWFLFPVILIFIIQGFLKELITNFIKHERKRKWDIE